MERRWKRGEEGRAEGEELRDWNMSKKKGDEQRDRGCLYDANPSGL